MSPTTHAACRRLLDRLQAQLLESIPAVDAVNSPLPIDRLPMLADAVRQYVEAEAILDGAVGADSQENH